MDWLEAAFGFGDQAEPAKPHRAPKPEEPPKIHSCVAVLRQPGFEGDLGEAVDCYWFVDSGTVVLCTSTGKRTGEEKHLAPGDDPRSVAKRLKRDALRREQNTERVRGFNRPLRYRPLSLA
jgi:hypothetical protein